MKVTNISVRVKRDVRHRSYVNSQVECTLTAEVEGDLEEAYKELHADVLFIVEEMEREEREYEKTR